MCSRCGNSSMQRKGAFAIEKKAFAVQVYKYEQCESKEEEKIREVKSFYSDGNSCYKVAFDRYMPQEKVSNEEREKKRQKQK